MLGELLQFSLCVCVCVCLCVCVSYVSSHCLFVLFFFFLIFWFFGQYVSMSMSVCCKAPCIECVWFSICVLGPSKCLKYQRQLKHTHKKLKKNKKKIRKNIKKKRYLNQQNQYHYSNNRKNVNFTVSVRV